MRSLLDLLSGDPRVQQQAVRGDAALTEEQFRRLEEGAVPIFAESSLRVGGAVPYKILNDPGAVTSRKIKLTDLSDPDVDVDGTGGSWDHMGQSFADQTVFRIHKNWTIPRLELETMRRSGTYDPLTALGQRVGERMAEFENKFIAGTLGFGTKGISSFASIQTFAAGASWTTAGQAWKDLTKAVDDKLRTQKVAVNNAALMLPPTEYVKLKNVFANTASFQMKDLLDLLPGGIYPTVEAPSGGKAYVYANTPTVLELEIFEDLSTIPLPMLDEDPRGRMRLSEAFHIFKPEGVVEITGTT